MLQGERNDSHCTFLHSQRMLFFLASRYQQCSSFPVRKCDGKSPKTDQTTRSLVDNPREAVKTKEEVPGH